MRRVLAVAVAVVLVSCGDHPVPPDGHIVGRDFTPAHTNFVMVGKTFVPQYVADEWNLTILSLHNPDWKGTVDVDQDVFNRCHQGDLWPQCLKGQTS